MVLISSLLAENDKLNNVIPLTETHNNLSSAVLLYVHIMLYSHFYSFCIIPADFEGKDGCHPSKWDFDFPQCTCEWHPGEINEAWCAPPLFVVLGGVFKPGLKWYVITGSMPWDATWLSSAFLFACSSHWLFQDDTLLVRGLVVICRCPGSPALEWGESTVSLLGKFNFRHLTPQIESKILVSSFAFNSVCTLLISCH